MRTTVNLDDDIFLLVKQVAQRENISLGEAIARLIREDAANQRVYNTPLKGRFALLPEREEVLTSAYVQQIISDEQI